ncbi:nickel pincer cofactor biosynthesis protein LarC [uncultured Bacteroides sp.]|uniref:nickel pincer cofactor biosynthesis protein LarC n=1 Tax=uncultured Bacteroides sp. TaxID=162156 RepID=UPI002AA71C8A|nr:nickel pincer cofactor biosynthesis protein LarC [uncultured Bacteroides sp.]
MKILYFDCFSGISGDMTLAALLDLGVDNDLLVSELRKLNVDGWEIKLSDLPKHGIGAKHVDVVLRTEAVEDEHVHGHLHSHEHEHETEKHPHVHRNMEDIAAIIDKSGISPGAKKLAKSIFMRLAVAEAKVHGTTPEKVHFHEVGAVDSIIDIVGVAICIDILSPDKIYASVLHDGYGFVKCQHGTIPVPVPAVTEVLSERGAVIKQLDIEGEMMTPTGAAIVAELAERFGPMPLMKITKIGYGAGKKDFDIPNILRLTLGETVEKEESDSIMVIETNVDDSTPEILGYVMEKLFGAGAWDVFFIPIYMKKCRPATMINVICDLGSVTQMENILFSETSTIGIRKYPVGRRCLPRKPIMLTTPFGEVKGKKIEQGETSRITIEYDDACRLARENNVPLIDVYNSINNPG